LDDDGNVIQVEEDDSFSDDEITVSESLCEPEQMLYMLELLLAFHAWYKRGHPFSMRNLQGKNEVRSAIQTMLAEI